MSSWTTRAPAPSSFIPPPPQSSSQRAERRKKEEAPKQWSIADGYLDLEDDNDWDQSDDELHKQERNRLARVHMKTARESTWPKDSPSSMHLVTNQELHGDWSGVTIDTTKDYDRLSSAAYRGDKFALGYIHYLNSKHQVLIAYQSPGVTWLVKHYASFAKGPQQAAMERYKAQLTRYRQQVGSHQQHCSRYTQMSPSIRGCSRIRGHQKLSIDVPSTPSGWPAPAPCTYRQCEGFDHQLWDVKPWGPSSECRTGVGTGPSA